MYSCGGPFCDGYILGIIAIALNPLAREIGLSVGKQGLVAAASLAGMFLGGALFGFLTDRYGRRTMYTLDLLLIVITSAAQFWVQGFGWLFVLRFLLGVGVGADYPIATALMAEFAPKRRRGMILAAMVGAWWLGYTVSFLVGYFLSLPEEPQWRWMLASSALPAALVCLLRWGTPESPRWLISQGRTVEAEQLIRLHFGAGYHIEEAHSSETDYRLIFNSRYGPRTAFVCLFWSCQIIPTFGIYTFAPELLRALGSPHPNLGTMITSLFFLVGVVAAILLIERFGRRPLLTIPFAITGAALVLLAWLPQTSTIAIALSFLTFAIFNAGSSVLQWVYPSELFPTEVRATALGFSTAVSRIGAAAGTFLVPVALQKFGVGYVMLAFGTTCGIGWLVAWTYAPETSGLSLTEASLGRGGPQ